MARSRSASVSDSDSTQRTTRIETDSVALTARAEDGAVGPVKVDVEKGAGDSDGDMQGQDVNKEPVKRDADGVAVEDGVPLVKLTGPDDPLSCVHHSFVESFSPLPREVEAREAEEG